MQTNKYRDEIKKEIVCIGFHSFWALSISRNVSTMLCWMDTTAVTIRASFLFRSSLYCIFTHLQFRSYCCWYYWRLPNFLWSICLSFRNRYIFYSLCSQRELHVIFGLDTESQSKINTRIIKPINEQNHKW